MLELFIPVLCFWGILLTVGVVVLTMVAGISENERDYILSNLTYVIIFSLVITSLFSLVVTRFVADMLYEKKFETIIPSFYASSALMLIIGTPLYAIYLALASRSLAELAMGVCSLVSSVSFGMLLPT